MISAPLIFLSHLASVSGKSYTFRSLLERWGCARRRCLQHAGFGVDGTAGMKKGLWGYESQISPALQWYFLASRMLIQIR